MKSLKIKNEKITIQPTDINEVTGDFKAFTDVAKPTFSAVKNIANTAGKITKFTFKTMFSPITYMIGEKLKGNKVSFKGWLKNVGNNLKELEDDIERVCKDYDNDFRTMMQAANISEAEINTLLFVGTPALAVSNMLQNKFAKNRSIPKLSAGSLDGYIKVIEKISFFVTYVITGKDPDKDSKVSGPLYEKLKPRIRANIESHYGKSAYEILNKLEDATAFGLHFDGIKKCLAPIFKIVDKDNCLLKPIEEINKVKNASINLTEIRKDLRTYADNNVNKKNEVLIRTLNVSSKILLEAVFSKANLTHLSFVMAALYYIEHEATLLKLLIELDSGAKENSKKFDALMKILENKKAMTFHVQSCYVAFLIKKTWVDIAKEALKDDTKDLNIIAGTVTSDVESSYVAAFPSSFKSTISFDNTVAKLIKNQIKSNEGDKYEFLKSSLETLGRSDDHPEFNYSAYKDGALFKSLKGQNVLSADDVKAFDIINKSGIGKIDSEREEVITRLESKISLKKAP
jgi:hypothetical protein